MRMNTGGMYRCCIENLQNAEQSGDLETLTLLYCDDCGAELQLVNGTWYWTGMLANNPEEPNAS